jgi:hypothetical protein
MCRSEQGIVSACLHATCLSWATTDGYLLSTSTASSSYPLRMASLSILHRHPVIDFAVSASSKALVLLSSAVVVFSLHQQDWIESDVYECDHLRPLVRHLARVQHLFRLKASIE